MNPIHDVVSKTTKPNSDEAYQKEQLKEACQQFEALFLSQILNTMSKTGLKSNLFGNSQEDEMWQSMLNEQRAELWSKQGGVGLANLLYEQLKQRL
jgi:flagellar protein FlgJ